MKIDKKDAIIRSLEAAAPPPSVRATQALLSNHLKIISRCSRGIFQESPRKEVIRWIHLSAKSSPHRFLRRSLYISSTKSTRTYVQKERKCNMKNKASVINAADMTHIHTKEAATFRCAACAMASTCGDCPKMDWDGWCKHLRIWVDADSWCCPDYYNM